MPRCGAPTKDGHPCRQSWILLSDGKCVDHSQSKGAQRARDLKHCKGSPRHELEICKKLVRGVEGKLRKKAEDKISELEEILASKSGKEK
jgi:hypothetical protein